MEGLIFGILRYQLMILRVSKIGIFSKDNIMVVTIAHVDLKTH